MKKSILAVGIFFSFILIGKAQEASPSVTPSINPNAADMKFESEVIDFGTINKGDDGNRVFKFKNVGKEPLIISNAVGSCGCTTPDWPKEPIKPGESASIKVHYDTNRIGAFEKTVTITSNGKEPSKVIKIKGTVKDVPAAVTNTTTPTPPKK